MTVYLIETIVATVIEKNKRSPRISKNQYHRNINKKRGGMQIFPSTRTHKHQLKNIEFSDEDIGLLSGN